MQRTVQPNPVISTTTTTTIKIELLEEHIITAYNTLSYQTDNTPCISASGMNVCETDKLICACPRRFEFGTKFLIDDKIWECQDRLHLKYDDRIDLLMDTVEEAKEFGKQELEIYIVR